MHTLQVILIRQQKHAPRVRNIVRFQNVIETAEIAKHNPHAKTPPCSIWWSLYLCINTFTREPPKTYPTALEKNTNEKYGYGRPVYSA